MSETVSDVKKGTIMRKNLFAAAILTVFTVLLCWACVKPDGSTGEASAPSRIDEVGHIVNDEQTFYWDDGETVVATMYSWMLVLDEDSAAADKINKDVEGIFRDYIDQWVEMYDGGFPGDQSSFSEEEYVMVTGYYHYIGVWNISYLSDKYLAFFIETHDYLGGAHGMPSLVPCIYDRTTGERLCITDIVEESEDEIIQKEFYAFAADYYLNPVLYWDFGAVEGIGRWGSTYYMMTDDGFYFCCAPYELGPYCSGFVGVTVPYSAFTMK